MSQTSISTTLTKSIAGQLADSGVTDVLTRVSAESSAEIPFGVAVKEGSGDNDANLPGAGTDKIAGIVLHSHAYAKDTELGSTGLKPKACLNVLRKGRVWAKAENAVSKGDRLFVRYAGTGDKGALRGAAVTNETVDCSKQGVWLTAASAGGLALLEVDFTNEPD